MTDNFFKIFHLDDLFKPVKEDFTYTLVVDLIHNSDNVRELVGFQSLNVFNFIVDDVQIVSWKYVRSDGEVITEGNDLTTLQGFFSNLEVNLKKIENKSN